MLASRRRSSVICSAGLLLLDLGDDLLRRPVPKIPGRIGRKPQPEHPIARRVVADTCHGDMMLSRRVLLHLLGLSAHKRGPPKV